MSCEIRSMITSYFLGSSIRTPPSCTNSAVTSSTLIALIFSTTAGGNVFSIPNRIPIFFTTQSPFLCCHPERSKCVAKRSTYVVEGYLRPVLQMSSWCASRRPRSHGSVTLSAHLLLINTKKISRCAKRRSDEKDGEPKDFVTSRRIVLTDTINRHAKQNNQRGWSTENSQEST